MAEAALTVEGVDSTEAVVAAVSLAALVRDPLQTTVSSILLRQSVHRRSLVLACRRIVGSEE